MDDYKIPEEVWEGDCPDDCCDRKFPFHVLENINPHHWAKAYLENSDLSMFFINRAGKISHYKEDGKIAVVTKTFLRGEIEPFLEKSSRILSAPRKNENKKQENARLKGVERIDSDSWQDSFVGKIFRLLEYGNYIPKPKSVDFLRPFILMRNNKVINVLTGEITDWNRSWGFSGKAGASFRPFDEIPLETRQLIDSYIDSSFPENIEERRHLLASIGCCFTGFVGNQTCYVIQEPYGHGQSFLFGFVSKIAGSLWGYLDQTALSNPRKVNHDSDVFSAINSRFAIVENYLSARVDPRRLAEWTESAISIRQARREYVEIQNESHLMIFVDAGRKEWYIPNEHDERRFCIYKLAKWGRLSETLTQDMYDYFFSLCIQTFMEDQSYGHLEVPQILKERRRRFLEKSVPHPKRSFAPI